MPYITVYYNSVIPNGYNSYFKELKEQGATGQQKLNRINRYLGILFAFVQGFAFSYAFLGAVGTSEIIKTTLILTAGTAFLLWLGDEITKKGIGNGMSLIIMAGIVNTLPNTFITAYQSLVNGTQYSALTGLFLFAIFVLVYIFIIVGVIYTQTAERRIPIQYSNRTSSAYSGNKSFIPIKLNSAGVVPVIFAGALIGIPSLIAEVLNKPAFTQFLEKYIVYCYTGFLLYMVLNLSFRLFLYLTTIKSYWNGWKLR